MLQQSFLKYELYSIKEEKSNNFYYPTNGVMIVTLRKRKDKNQHISKTSKAKCLIKKNFIEKIVKYKERHLVI